LGRERLTWNSGNELVISAIGTVSSTIEEGAYILLTVKYGLIRLISTKADLCEQVKNVDLECPIEKGVLNLSKVVSLPAEIPPVSLPDAPRHQEAFPNRFRRENTPFSPMYTRKPTSP
jgi:hypothetical protein